MSTLPTIGQEPWGEDLNLYLTSLETRVASNEAVIAASTARIGILESQAAAQATRITSLETKQVDQGVRITGVENRIGAVEARLSALEASSLIDHVFNSYAWTYNNGAPPATGSQVRFNNPDLTLATLIDIRKIDNDGADRTPVFQQLNSGDAIRINDWDNASVIHRFRAEGAPVIGATNVQIPIVWISGAGQIPNAKVNVSFLVTLNLA